MNRLVALRTGGVIINTTTSQEVRDSAKLEGEGKVVRTSQTSDLSTKSITFPPTPSMAEMKEYEPTPTAAERKKKEEENSIS